MIVNYRFKAYKQYKMVRVFSEHNYTLVQTKNISTSSGNTESQRFAQVRKTWNFFNVIRTEPSSLLILSKRSSKASWVKIIENI